MGKEFTTRRVGSTVTADYNGERSYTLRFANEEKAKFFMSELSATQEDFKVNGRDNAVRKKSIFMEPADCSVSMNFNTENSSEKWPMKVALGSVSEMRQFYADIKFAVWGPMPSIWGAFTKASKEQQKDVLIRPFVALYNKKYNYVRILFFKYIGK